MMKEIRISIPQGIFLLLLFILFNPVTSVAQSGCDCKEANKLAFDSLNDNNDSTGAYTLINRLKQSPDKNCAVIGYNYEFEYLTTRRKKDESLQVILQQEKIISSLPCREELSINTYLNYTRYYRNNDDYEKVSLYAFKALANAEKRKDKVDELRSIKQIVYLFTRQDQDEKNWDYIKRAEAIITKLEEDHTTGENYNWLAFEYENKYTLTNRATLLDSALLFATKAKNIAGRFKNYEQITQSFRVFEAVSYHREDLRKAVSYTDSAVFYARLIKIPKDLGSLYLAKAWDLVDLNENAEAMRWADTSIFYGEKYSPGSPSTMLLYSESAKIFETAGMIPKAFAAFKKYEHIKDSIFKIQRSEKINELEQQYNKAKNEKTIKELAQQRRIYLLLALAGLFGLIALIFLIRQQALKNKQKVLETEQRLNRARMNPHFFFNALSSLQSFALQENDGKALASNLSKFSHIMRETLESTYKEYVTIEQEKDFLNEYLELQKVRFPHKFTYEIKSGTALEPEDVLLPAMILQPFVENSIEHGFTGIDYPGHITIAFDKDSSDLHISITDNGKGLMNTVKGTNEHISRASQIIKDRIYLLNVKLKTRASFSVDNNVEKGVTVLIKLPLLYKQDLK